MIVLLELDDAGIRQRMMQHTGIVMDEEDVELFHTLSDKLSEQKAAKKETKVHINNQGLTGEEYEKAEKLSNKPKRERSKEEEELLKSCKTSARSAIRSSACCGMSRFACRF